MSKTNCINCGAAKEVSDLKCPFCGTEYTDISTIELFSGKPLFIQLKDRNGNITTAKAYVTNTTLSMHPEVTCLYSADQVLERRVSAMHISGSIDFTLYENIFSE